MANKSPFDEFRTARVASGLLLVLLAVMLGLLDAIRTDFELNPLILVPILVTGAGMLAVDINIGRK